MTDILPAIPTIPRLLEQSARRYANSVAIEDGDLKLSYADLHLVAKIAARALMALGVEQGERVAIWAPNLHEWIVSALGIHLAGGVLVPINTRMKGAEAADILARSGVRVLISIGDFLGVHYPDMLAEHAIPSLEHVVVLRSARAGQTSWQSFMTLAEGVPEAMQQQRSASVAAESPSDLLFTSGTTGRPKGVVTTHGQNLAAFAAWSDIVRLQAGDRYLIVNPFFHAFGYKAGWLAALIRGATILPHQQFDAQAVLRRIATDHVSFLPGSPTLYLSLLAHPQLKAFDLSSLRIAVTGAANVAPELVLRMRQELGFESVFTAYGLTECCGLATVCRPEDDVQTIATTCGRPLPGVELRCVDGDGNSVAAGTPGEVLIRGFNVMQGYFDDEAATREAVDRDGWLHTGDVGIVDERGNLRITDRLKDMFIAGGFNCYPAEIENLISSHPAVAQVAVVGVPDERLGEVGKAYVVLRTGASLSSESFIDWCREHMANYKVPRAVAFVSALPLNASGKVMKQALREVAAR
ncbi:FadD3 family acyl-CoA ligase [Crenobacter sp. SG2305]|uniref:FadD3 family acyl-CoA ligase n=1 Tax=Crenobacter oryzisoli TaxID=3056844 RepID=UPI0025AA43B0|nr:FadD3 family acyl-CoA ligase [Crenobacter sp. SG2305]MDN0084521.1 FadD3 family acyl-CoA ligase [Crenobacter sp. SG2305]